MLYFYLEIGMIYLKKSNSNKTNLKIMNNKTAKIMLKNMI